MLICICQTFSGILHDIYTPPFTITMTRCISTLLTFTFLLFVFNLTSMCYDVYDKREYLFPRSGRKEVVYLCRNLEGETHRRDCIGVSVHLKQIKKKKRNRRQP